MGAALIAPYACDHQCILSGFESSVGEEWLKDVRKCPGMSADVLFLSGVPYAIMYAAKVAREHRHCRCFSFALLQRMASPGDKRKKEKA